MNGTRPRTVVKKINDIEVERTYFIYKPLEETVERAAFPGAAYGASGALRTVRTWFPVDLDGHRAGRLKSVRREGGHVDLHNYFWTADVWTETVTRVHEDGMDPVAMQAARHSAAYGRFGNLIETRRELRTGADARTAPLIRCFTPMTSTGKRLRALTWLGV